ncbi:amino acid--tRNA ligase-related protein [Candidatus Similichlamydia laticola]|nr:amino acid--tRNA ligase-related protein [Candidatus Similichlamydia laticola]
MLSKHHRLDWLKARFHFIRSIRYFFEQRGFIEADCSLASRTRIIEPYIELVPIWMNGEKGWLYPSPEVGLKKLLSLGIGDVFQISHTFRNGEHGSKHNSEFTMLEWYRVNMSFQGIIQEAIELVSLFCGKLPHRIVTYTTLFEERFGINPHTSSLEELLSLFQKEKLCPYSGLLESSKNDLLNFLMGSHLEKAFPKDCLTVVTDYPAHQTVMSSLKDVNGYKVAMRFEIYLGDLELANGSQEATDAGRQIEELQAQHEEYVKRTGEDIRFDFSFLEALKKLPPCCGVAVGVDRLCMLGVGSESIHDILVFPY